MSNEMFHRFDHRRSPVVVWVIAVVLLLVVQMVFFTGASADGSPAQSAPDSALVDSVSAGEQPLHAPSDTSFVPTGVATAAADSAAAVVVPELVVPTFGYSRFDSVAKPLYLLRHSFSLDNFMEHEPGFMLGRYGPIGRSTLQSRYSFGRGRCSVLLNDTPVNDPQNGVAPLAYLPVSGLGVLLKGAGAGDRGMGGDGMEGWLGIGEEPPPPIEPTTFLELSKSTKRNLRQRRVWFASMREKIGLDFGYDEVLNDGYSFDARQLESPDFISGEDYGRAHSRYLTLNFRGRLPNNDSYKFSLRRFVVNTSGDLNSASGELGFSGHLASVSARLGTVKLNLFSRGYDSTARPSQGAEPDSNTVNLTTAVYVDWRPAGNERRALTLGGGYETIRWVQEIGRGSDSGLLRKYVARLTAVSRVGRNWDSRLQASATHYDTKTTGWGGMFNVSRALGRHKIAVYAERGYRMPNLGELFLPEHDIGTGGALGITGNSDLDSEFAWEGGGSFTSQIGPLTNEVRVLGLRVHRPIAYLPTNDNGTTVLVASNADTEEAGVFEDRIRLDTVLSGFELNAAGSVARSGSDREIYFRTVPMWTAHASFRFGRSVFQATSALYIGLDYTYRSSRGTMEGPRLPGYHLLNLKLDGRLLGADMYLMVMNTLDSQYQTILGYLMTPRTIVYGLSWRIFD